MGQFGDRDTSILGWDGAQPLDCWAQTAELLLAGSAICCLMMPLLPGSVFTAR